MFRMIAQLLRAGLFIALLGAHVSVAEPLDKLTISGPMAVVTYPLLTMVENGKFAQLAKEVEVKIWQNPDQLRALIVGKSADVIAVPTNVAAMFYNKGIDLQLLNVSVWGILHMVSRDKNLKTLADFKGKKIAMPFKGDMPDIVFSELARQQGLDPEKDFMIRHVSNPMDAVQLLILRRVDHALLAEPAVSMVLYKTKNHTLLKLVAPDLYRSKTKNHTLLKLVAPDLYRSVDLQQEWGKIFTSTPEIPQAGIAVLPSLRDKPELLAIFQEEYRQAVTWCKEHPAETGEIVVRKEHPAETGEIVVRYIKGLKPVPVANAIGNTLLKWKTTPESKQELERFCSVLAASDPKKIGGKLPDDSFYQ